jgi:hypothetical protein
MARETEPEEQAPDAEVVPRSPGPVTSAAFWSLMERWDIPVATALRLIDHPGAVPASGKPPRFRMRPSQSRRFHYLVEIEQALEAMGDETGTWLKRRSSDAPLSGRTPLDHMQHHGMQGMQDVLRLLNRQSLRRALRDSGNRRR